MLNQGKKKTKKRRAAKGKWKTWHKKEPQNNFILSVALCGPFSFNSHTVTICICTCVCLYVCVCECLHYPCNFRLAFWLQFEFLTCLCYLLYCVLFPLLRQREREEEEENCGSAKAAYLPFN